MTTWLQTFLSLGWILSHWLASTVDPKEDMIWIMIRYVSWYYMSAHFILISKKKAWVLVKLLPDISNFKNLYLELSVDFQFLLITFVKLPIISNLEKIITNSIRLLNIFPNVNLYTSHCTWPQSHSFYSKVTLDNMALFFTKIKMIIIAIFSKSS